MVKLVELRNGLHSFVGLWKEYILPVQSAHLAMASPSSQISAGIQYFGCTFYWKILLLEAGAHPIAENGQLLDAHIRIRGFLQLVRWEIVEDCYKPMWGEEVAEPESADD